MRYFLRPDGGTTCCSEDTPSYLPTCLTNYKEITKEEYDALNPQEVQLTPEDDFKYYDAEMQEAEWKEEESVKIDYNPVAESVKRTEPVERYF